MDWNSIMNIMLPPRNGIVPHQTSPFGPRNYAGKDFHYGVDFNYNVPGQSGINLTHPPVYSPIAGTVVAVVGSTGGVIIRDSAGLYHGIFHMSSQSVAKDDKVTQGQLIGTMGAVGVSDGKVHVHYQISDSPSRGGKLVNPVDYWNPAPLPRPRPARPDAPSDATPAEAQTGATPRQLYLSDRFYKSRTGAPLYASDRFVTDLKSAAAMRRTPLFNSDAVEIGVQNPAGEIGVENPATEIEAEKPAAAGFNERFGSFAPVGGSQRASPYDAGGNARPWSWRDTVVDSQNRLIQPVDHVDWDRVGRGQAGVPTRPQYGADGQPVGEPVQQVVAPNGAGPDEATDRAAASRQQAIAAHLARVNEAKQRIPDFDQVIRSGGHVQVAPGVADEILNSEKSALLQYHLAGNPDKLAELNGLSGKNLAREIGRLEGRLYLPTAGTVTEASPPLSDVRGGAAPVFDPHTTDDMDAFANWLREDQARRRPA